MIAWHFFVTFLLPFLTIIYTPFLIVIALPFLGPFCLAGMRFNAIGNGIHDKTV